MKETDVGDTGHLTFEIIQLLKQPFGFFKVGLRFTVLSQVALDGAEVSQGTSQAGLVVELTVNGQRGAEVG